jgi:hypothetical protein
MLRICYLCIYEYVHMCICVYIYIYISSNEYIQITLKTEDPKVRYLYEIWLHVEIIAS